MARKWVAVYQEEDLPYGDEIRISIEGTEAGFVAVPETGDDLGLMPMDTPDEAREELAYNFAGYDTFRWLDE
ncbi:MAG: hypothetical protein IJ751_08255 [Oscillospiraceae bacterium]|nr:hypothetical protein [Oscillospiraceae bacterium]